MPTPTLPPCQLLGIFSVPPLLKVPPVTTQTCMAGSWWVVTVALFATHHLPAPGPAEESEEDESEEEDEEEEDDGAQRRREDLSECDNSD